ncbi:MAG: LysM peptidoglycan-binding domain-containing protein [Caldilineaceae bacterium]|nr:LysM peptidoglycan-binding domain-containing protein [Caldilineaceae bacterium]
MSTNHQTRVGWGVSQLLSAFLWALIVIALLPVPAAWASPATRPVTATAYAVYTVQRGDTLSAIARRVGSTVPALVSLNRLSNANQISVGQTILIPAATEDRGPTSSYVVQRGDTLSALARRYQTTVGLLLWLNGIANPNQIRVGQTLLVPTSGSGDPAAPLRIRFPTGGTSATVTGTIHVGARVCYIFGATAGQTATLQITSPGDAANFDFAPADLAVNGGVPFKRLVNEDRTFSQLLPVTGDYIACVATPTDRVTYALTVTIPPLTAACPTPNTAIRSTDWESVITSDPALTHELIDGRLYVTVIGASSEVSGHPLTSVVVYGDFDDDCVEEAALPLDSGGTAGSIGYLVYRASAPTPHLIASGNGYKLSLRGAAQRLVVTMALYAGWEPNCCPSGFTHTTYRLVGDVLTLVTRTTEGIPGMAVATVEQFYTDLNNRDFANAYALLSPTFHSAHPFAAWQAGYANTVSFSVTVTADPSIANRVQVTIHAVESTASGTVSRTYVGSWDLVWSEAGWLLNSGTFRRA